MTPFKEKKHKRIPKVFTTNQLLFLDVVTPKM